MDVGSIISILMVGFSQIFSDLVDYTIHVYNNVETVNNMEIDVFVNPPFINPPTPGMYECNADPFLLRLKVHKDVQQSCLCRFSLYLNPTLSFRSLC